jgi:signal transduction histidine kinase/ligand-binding sensor domain-containing protein/DNA-binding response OmpR family regulator
MQRMFIQLQKLMGTILRGILRLLWSMLPVAIFMWLTVSPELLPARGNTFVFEHFTQENGLSNNQVQCIFQDSKGYMWFGTSQGLSRFDGYRFTVFENIAGNNHSLRGNLVRCIFQSKSGTIYAGTENGGLNVFDSRKERFSHPFVEFAGLQLENASVNCIVEDQFERLWLGSDDGIIRYHPDGNITRIQPGEAGPDKFFEGNFVRVMAFGRNGKLWLGTNNGVFVLDTAENRVTPVYLPLPPTRNEEIWELVAEPDGKIWIGTYENAVFVTADDGQILQHIIPDRENERSYTVRAISRDKFGSYWMGTRGGVYVYKEGDGVNGNFIHDEREEKSLSGNSVLSVFHDDKGDTWIGTRLGISYLVHSKQVFRSYRAMPDDKKYLNSKEIYAFWREANGHIWIGTEDGGVNIFNPEKNDFEYLTHNPNNRSTLSSNCIKAFMEDGRGNVWVGTFRGGISVVNLSSRKTVKFYRQNPNRFNSIADDRVWDLFRDSRNNIWAATSAGIELYNPESDGFSLLNIFPPGTQVNWIREDLQGDLWFGGRDEIVVYSRSGGVIHRYRELTRYFHEDSKGRIWIATLNNGIAQYSKNEGAIRYFREQEGIANNQTLCILEDNNKFLWISTTDGLTRFNPETGFNESYTAKDGLQNNQFNYGAALKLPNGDLVFGGISGFNVFDPLAVRTNDYAAPIVLTDFRVFNRSVPIEEGRKAILPQSISETSEVRLPFKQNVISIEFAALNYVNSQNNLYSYFLEGFDKAWTDPSTNRLATYTNLDPGDYTFHIKSFIPGIPDAGKGATLKIVISPPYWKTWWFKMLAFLVITLLIFTLLHFLLNREVLKNQLVFERVKAKKLHELDMLKLRFFTNISHEIRTPLTLILGPLEKLQKSQVPQNELPQLIDIMHRNAKQLDRLINQILDFRKLETGNLKLSLSDGDLVSFLNGVVDSFQLMAKENSINLSFNSSVDTLLTRFDPDKMEKIINNLISNALKFTETNGKISLSLTTELSDKKSIQKESGLGKGRIKIVVADTGKGIPEKHLDKIFNRFFQSDQETDLPGTGIGLALVMELVKLHKGEIYVTSKPGKGSKFTITLPWLYPMLPVGAEGRDAEETAGQPQTQETQDDEQLQMSDERIMLIVEDNADVRKFIRLHFEPAYRVVEAENGLKGWQEALECVPDIVLCDVMMPGMNGYELLKRLKQDERTSHIPVILLTALGSKEHEIQGLTIGADDYITKPFDIHILQTKIENILAIRNSLKQKYSGQVILQPQNIMISPPDERFLKHAIEVVEQNIADPDLDIERFATEVGVSRMQLYRKLNALTNMTVKEFIRDIRLKRASQLLMQKNMTVSEVAYAVGFREMSHFRKCFRQEYGMSASEFVQKNS